jgi:PAS domain-containing protein
MCYKPDYNPRMASAEHGPAQPGRAEDIRLLVDTIPVSVWLTRPDGSAEFFNQRWLEYTGLPREQALDWGWKVAIHSPFMIASEWRAIRKLFRSHRYFRVADHPSGTSLLVFCDAVSSRRTSVMVLVVSSAA